MIWYSNDIECATSKIGDDVAIINDSTFNKHTLSIIDFDRLSIRDASNHDIASDGDNIYFVDGFVFGRGNYIRFNKYFDGFSCNFAVRIERKFDRGCAFFEWSEEQVAHHDFGFHDWLVGYFVYTFDDDSGSYIFIINDSNRFLGKENLLFK